MGIVFIQVSMLRLNAGISRAITSAETLSHQNASLRADISKLDSGERIADSAGALGMIQPAAGSVNYLDARKGDARAAVQAIRPPKKDATGASATGGSATGATAAAQATTTAQAAPAIAQPQAQAATAPPAATTAATPPVTTQAPATTAAAPPATTTAPAQTAAPTQTQAQAAPAALTQTQPAAVAPAAGTAVTGQGGQ